MIKTTLAKKRVKCRRQCNRHFRNEKGTGAEMRPAIGSGLSSGSLHVTRRSAIGQFLLEVFAKITSAQFPSRFFSGGIDFPQ